MHGRSADSKIDLQVYCPEEVLQRGGPLFADSEGIQSTLDTFLSEKIADDKFKIPKCIICGFPDCECEACKVILTTRSSNTKTKQKVGHTCALQYAELIGAPPKKGYYDKEMGDHLLMAWQEKGVNAAPVFSKKDGQSGYYWPEELEQHA